MNDTELMDTLRARSGLDDDRKIRVALDASAKGIGARLPNDIRAELAADLPPLLADPLMTGSPQSPATPNELYSRVGEAANVGVEDSLSITQSVLQAVVEGAKPSAVDRARQALPRMWAELLQPSGS